MTANHLSALDGLRGFAAMVVIVSHCAAFGFLPEFLGKGFGQMGVMLFFGLSGFLMAYLYCGRTLDRESLREYAINRTTRVLPLYYAIASLVALAFILFDVSLLKAFTWKDVAGNMLLLKGSSVLWTIPVELHFYVVFVGLWYAANQRRFLLCAAILGAAHITALVGLYLIGLRYGPVLFSWLHLFLFGSVIGAYYEPLRRKAESALWKGPLTAFGWLVMLAAVLAPPQVRRNVGIETLVNYLDPITLAFPMLFLVGAVFVLGPFALFRHPVMRWYGAISYSLYLTHAFVIDAATALVERGVISHLVGLPLVLGVATLVAAASFYWFEKPAQKKLRAYFSRREQRTSFA